MGASSQGGCEPRWPGRPTAVAGPHHRAPSEYACFRSHTRAATDDAAVRVAERRKRAAHPELSTGGPQQLVVLGTEIGNLRSVFEATSEDIGQWKSRRARVWRLL